MSNKKVNAQDMLNETRAARRHIQRRQLKRICKQVVEKHNAEVEYVPFDHKAERRSRQHKLATV